MKDIENLVCANCWDIVLGPQKTKDAEYFGINSKQYCSLGCFYEDYEKGKNDYKSFPPKAVYTVKAKIKKVIKGKPLKYRTRKKKK